MDDLRLWLSRKNILPEKWLRFLPQNHPLIHRLKKSPRHDYIGPTRQGATFPAVASLLGLFAIKILLLALTRVIFGINDWTFSLSCWALIFEIGLLWVFDNQTEVVIPAVTSFLLAWTSFQSINLPGGMSVFGSILDDLLTFAEFTVAILLLRINFTKEEEQHHVNNRGYYTATMILFVQSMIRSFLPLGVLSRLLIRVIGVLIDFFDQQTHLNSRQQRQITSYQNELNQSAQKKTEVVEKIVPSVTVVENEETNRKLKEALASIKQLQDKMSIETKEKTELNAKIQQLERDYAVLQENYQTVENERTRLSFFKQQVIEDTHLSFLAKLSHELRTSMNGVSGMITLLSDSNLAQEQLEYVQTLEKAVESLMTLINDSLSFSRIETQDTLQEVSFNLESLLEDAFDLVANRVGDKDVDVSYEIEPDVPALMVGDPSHIRNILCNLLSNGIKFTTQGDVSVNVKVAEKRSEDEVVIRMQVEDTGTGIPDNQIDHVFEPFSVLSGQTIREYGGSGLGLAICQKLARVLKAKLSVENSTSGKGAIFTFEIPLKVDREALKSQPPPVQNPYLEGARIFIIDDNKRILKLLDSQLQACGCIVQSASNWVDGIKDLKKASVGLGQPYHLLLLDYSMPGINGIDVSRLIRKDNNPVNNIPIILMGSRTQRKENPGNVHGWLMKPLKRNLVIDAVSRICKETNQTIRKPLLQTDKSSRAPTAVTNAAKPSIQLKVLVAEDNPMNQRIIQSIVSKAGHACKVASNGEEALTEYQAGGYDVIFMDCRMPVLDGFEATKKIRDIEGKSQSDSHTSASHAPKHIPIIALTADVEHGTREQCLNVGMDDYLCKPIKKGAIEEILSALVESRSTAQPAKPDAGSAEYEINTPPKVLLVEDNVVNLRIGSVILRKHKFDVDVATNGAQSVEMVKNNHDLYQIVLMDMHMPGMDGISATEIIRDFEKERNLRAVPIIALTADTTEGFRGTCLAAGCSEYMPKPVDYPLLVQLCKKFVTDYRKPE
eukprot:TRINITY_DN2880_c0_g1_i1.p1 TRINITY_DN2880_c0_g1~~TRINITY_DN2880_c0_g1_i1.p1  ORF type:complete len:1007 (+),score=257.77 TRINITY_DN2880_c0_g1_i1:16-3036(+)